jgi:hypothetical protein
MAMRFCKFLGLTLLLAPALHGRIAAAEPAPSPTPQPTATAPENTSPAAAGSVSAPVEGAVETPISAAEVFGPADSPRVSRLSTSTGFPHAPFYVDLGVAVCSHCKTPPGTGGLTILKGPVRVKVAWGF